MAAIAGYTTTVKKSGTSTAFTGEACANTSGNSWQISDATKEVWDRGVVPTFYDNAVEIDSADIASIDYLFGTVTFTGSKSGPITVDGNYLPLSAVGGANAYNLSMGGDVLDDTDYPAAQANGGFHTRKYGLHDVSVTVSRWDEADQEIYNLIKNRTVVVIEVRPGGSGDFARGFFVADAEQHEGDISVLESLSATFMLDGNSAANFSWGT